MRSVKVILGLGVIALSLTVASAPALAAAPEWEDCVEIAPGTGAFTNALCTTAGKGNFSWAMLLGTEKVTGKGTLELEDGRAGTEISCEVTTSGTVGPAKADKVEVLTSTACKFIKAGICEAAKPVTASYLHKPWTTELEPKVGEVRDKITAGTGGEPEFNIECTVGGIFKVADQCKGLTDAKITNVVSNSTVEALFDANSPRLTCAVGGATQGRIGGPVILKQENGNGLKVS